MSPPTLVELLHMRARDRPGAPALYGRVDDGWRQLSWEQWWQAARQAAKGLITLDLEVGDSVILVSTARAEWAVAHPAICAAGAVPVLVHPDTPAAMLARILALSEAKIVIVDGADRLEQVLEHRSDAGVALSHVVTLDRLPLRADRVLDLDALMQRGASVPTDEVDARIAQLTSNDPVMKVFTGDRDGPWRVVSHDRLVGTASEQLATLGDGPCVVFNSVVPATEGALATTLGFAAHSGGELWFTPDARGLTDARPHVALLKPEHWSEVLSALEVVADDTSGWRAGLMSWSRLQARSQSDGWTSALAHTVLHPVLEICGLAQTVGYAQTPLAEALADELSSLGVDVRPLFGR